MQLETIFGGQDKIQTSTDCLAVAQTSLRFYSAFVFANAMHQSIRSLLRLRAFSVLLDVYVGSVFILFSKKNLLFSCKVAQLQIQDECPISPGVNFNKTFHMKPLAQICDQGMVIRIFRSFSKYFVLIIL